MRFFIALLFGVCVLLGTILPAMATGEAAMTLRKANSLCEFTPPQTFLNGNFVADEMDPSFIFGKISDFTKSLSCSTSWLIEEREKARLESLGNQSAPVEYTLYLEQDCAGKVMYYVFVDRSQANNSQWLEWRRQFHKSKAEPEFGSAMENLEKASMAGFPVNAELRFIEASGNLELKKPEDTLTGELKLKPIYDLKQGKALPR